MQWQSLNLFPSPVIKIPINEFEKAKGYFYEHIYQGGDSSLSHYFSGDNVFKRHPDLTDVAQAIEQAGSFAYQQLLNYKQSGAMKITGAWLNLCQQGGAQMKHSHANSLLSGTLYLNTDENSEITFYHPLSTDSMHAELHDEPDLSHNEFGLKYHYREVSVAVRQGDCLFWPSQLRHGYTNNRTQDRLSLSFNLMPSHLNSVYQLID